MYLINLIVLSFCATRVLFICTTHFHILQPGTSTGKKSYTLHKLNFSATAKHYNAHHVKW